MQFTIKQARTHANLTQQQMADHLGIDRSTYIKMEHDPLRATVGQINKIARITSIPISQFFLDAPSTLVEGRR